MSGYRFGASGIVTDNILEPLLNSLPDIIHSVDKDGKIVFTNKRASELLGYTIDELIGLDVFDIYAPEIQSQAKKGFQALQKKGDMVIRESLLKTKEGDIIPVEIRSFGVYDENGEFIRTFSMLRDIREMREMRDNLMHAERLSGIGQLASCVVHDIHNPLMVIQLYTEMLMHDAKRLIVEDAVNEVNDYLNQMRRASEKIQKLLNHLRNFSRRQADTWENTDLNAIIDDALFMVMNKIVNRSIRVVRENKEEEFPISGSRIQLEQVVMNLISNACDAMTDSEQKILSIRVGDCESEGEQYYEFVISDTGCGIPGEDIDKIFTSFFTTKKPGEGTGIGLSICKDIIDSHRGRVKVESTAGIGTRFHLMLPVPEDK